MHRLHRAVAATAVLGASSTIHSLTSFTAECSPSPSPVVNVDIPSDVSHITDNANIKLVPRLANFITRCVHSQMCMRVIGITHTPSPLLAHAH